MKCTDTGPELDKERLGIMGTSLGSFMAALTAEMEPRYARVAVLLGGGGAEKIGEQCVGEFLLTGRLGGGVALTPGLRFG